MISIRSPSRSRVARTTDCARSSWSLLGSSSARLARRPAVVLRVGELDTVGTQIICHVEDAANSVDVQPVQDDVQGERPAQLLHQPRHHQLAFERRSAGDPIGQGLLVGLNADLYVVESRVTQLLGATRGEAEPAGDQIGVHAKLIGALHQLDDVVALQRLATREVQLQHSELGGLGKHPLPLLGRQLIAILVERERV